MNEDFLHYVWKFQKFKTQQLTITTGETLQVIKVGTHNYNAGPDFFNGQVVIGDQKWAGTIEIHLRSSDWYMHNHETDRAYDNVILHVVWQHDAAVFRPSGSQIPTLVLAPFVASEILKNYQTLFSQKSRWIVCETQFPEVSEFTLTSWLERLYIERLEHKSKAISERLKALDHHWEAVLFEMLAKSFGLAVNGASFLSIARSFPFNYVQRYAHDVDQLEALFLGQAGFFDDDAKDAYQLKQQENYQYLVKKHDLHNDGVARPKYFRLRPHNFPTIRLSQLANLYCQRTHLFSDIIEASSLDQLYDVFAISALSYWETHYSFGVKASSYKRTLSRPFIDLLIINTVLPIKFCFARHTENEDIEALIAMSRKIKKEDNMVIKRFNTLKKIASNAFDSQALLQLKKQYCSHLKCVQCAIGNEILGNKK